MGKVNLSTIFSFLNVSHAHREVDVDVRDSPIGLARSDHGSELVLRLQRWNILGVIYLWLSQLNYVFICKMRRNSVNCRNLLKLV